jgi:nucleoside-diphosphate-sugar epimerase
MNATPTILITGAAGNLGAKLSRHWRTRYPLRLLDRVPHGEEGVLAADLCRWDAAWVRHFHGADAVVHLAADPTAQQSWPNLLAPNVDALLNVFAAAAEAGVKRILYASSNHVMGGYKDDPEPASLTTDLPPRPGTHYEVERESRDSSPYGCTKLFGERLGQCFADAYGLSVLAIRFGWVRPGDNRAEDIPPARGAWFRLMWLSNRDYLHLMDCCLSADPSLRFAILHGMSANSGMRWDLESTRRLVGYQPADDVTRFAS